METEKMYTKTELHKFMYGYLAAGLIAGIFIGALIFQAMGE